MCPDGVCVSLSTRCCASRSSWGLSFPICHTPSGEGSRTALGSPARPPTHLVQQYVGVWQQVVRLRAETARRVQGLRLEDRALVRIAARHAPGCAAADVVAQVVLTHDLHHAARPRLF